jgi:hypothetical protein
MCHAAPNLRYQALSVLKGIGDDRALTLAFLETKAYDHPIWSSFIDAGLKSLLERTQGDLDSDLLRDIHLFTVVCGDAERTEVHHAGDENKLSQRLEVFFETLAGRDVECAPRAGQY